MAEFDGSIRDFAITIRVWRGWKYLLLATDHILYVPAAMRSMDNAKLKALRLIKSL